MANKQKEHSLWNHFEPTNLDFFINSQCKYFSLLNASPRFSFLSLSLVICATGEVCLWLGRDVSLAPICAHWALALWTWLYQLMPGLRRPQTQKPVEVIFYYFLNFTQQYKTSNLDLSASRILSYHLGALLARQQTVQTGRLSHVLCGAGLVCPSDCLLYRS